MIQTLVIHGCGHKYVELCSVSGYHLSDGSTDVRSRFRIFGRFCSGISFCICIDTVDTNRHPSPCQSWTLSLPYTLQSSLLQKTYSSMSVVAGDTQCEVVLVGCGAPNRGMGWYASKKHPKQVVVVVCVYGVSGVKTSTRLAYSNML
jgi:hypothetical protein